MTALLKQILSIYQSMPTAKRVVVGIVLVVVVSGFTALFFLGNQINYQAVFTGLSPEDASQIVDRLKEQGVAYRLAANGTVIEVPAEKVYDIRLAMAGEGLPKGGSVGFEIFNETDFGTTEFVQKLNYQRALQGELARTIREFHEVIDARVMIVMAKKSVFVEEAKPPSASVLLKLKTRLSKEKTSAVVHLVASAVEELTPDRVTVVDTNGNVLSKGVPEEEGIGNLANTQLEYKAAYEQRLTRRIESMLEKIVGRGKAIARVNADIDFDQVDINEEIYDPDVRVVRSRQNMTESTDRKSGPAGGISSVNPVSESGGNPAARQTADVSKRQDETVNYEINRTIRRTAKPTGTLRRLSVAVVLDGTYTTEPDADGNPVRKYQARSAEELDQFKKIVQNAMGYSIDREDQVTVESFPLHYMADMALTEPGGFDWEVFARHYGRTLAQILLLILAFLFIVRPVLKTVKDIKAAEEPTALPPGEEEKALPEPEKMEALPEPQKITIRQKAGDLARQDIDKAANLVKGWLSEVS